MRLYRKGMMASSLKELVQRGRENFYKPFYIHNKLANSKDALPCGETYGLQ